jgi:hypothetical protein
MSPPKALVCKWIYNLLWFGNNIIPLNSTSDNSSSNSTSSNKLHWNVRRQSSPSLSHPARCTSSPIFSEMDERQHPDCYTEPSRTAGAYWSSIPDWQR